MYLSGAMNENIIHDSYCALCTASWSKEVLADVAVNRDIVQRWRRVDGGQMVKLKEVWNGDVFEFMQPIDSAAAGDTVVAFLSSYD